MHKSNRGPNTAPEIEVEVEDEDREEEANDEEPREIPPLNLSVDELSEFAVTPDADLERLRAADEAAEIAVEHLVLKPGQDIVGRVFSVEQVDDMYDKPAPGMARKKVPVLVFLGSVREADSDGVETAPERRAMFRLFAKASMGVLIAQSRGFEFRMKVKDKVQLADKRARWTLSIRALRGRTVKLPSAQ